MLLEQTTKKAMTASPPSPLADITRLLLELGGEAEAQVEKAIQALSKRDLKLAFEVSSHDVQLDEIHTRINDESVDVLAGILDKNLVRENLAIVKAAAQLKRVGEHAASIAKRLQATSGILPPAPAAQLTRLGTLARQILRESLDAYIRRDRKAALTASRHDREIDDLYASLLQDLLHHIAADRTHVPIGTEMLFIAKSLERIGDHARAIAALVPDLTGVES